MSDTRQTPPADPPGPRMAADVQPPIVLLEPHREKPGGKPAPRLHVETCYRGVPIYSAATLVQTRGREATLHVNRCLANALMRTGAATVCAEAWATPINGRVSRVDLDTLHVTIEDLSHGVLPVNRRTDQRITVDETISVRLSAGEREVTGRLIDISIRAVAALYGNVDLSDFNVDQPVRIGMILPGGKASDSMEFDVDGRILRVDPVTGGTQPGWRVAVELGGDEVLLDRLARYIGMHQQAVLHELSQGRAPATPSKS